MILALAGQFKQSFCEILGVQLSIFFLAKDIDECSTGESDCDVNALCSNTIGLYVCRCARGYDGDGKTCLGTCVHCTCYRRYCESRKLCARNKNARGSRSSFRAHEFYAGHSALPTCSNNSNVAALKKRYNRPQR